MTTVLILFGGQSPEHEVSMRSARNVVDALDSSFHPVIVGIDLDGHWHLMDGIPDGNKIHSDNKVFIDPGTQCLIHQTDAILIDVVFPVLHGPNGENGAVQGLVEMLDIPYVGTEILGSAVAMDKAVAKTLMKASGLTVAKGRTLYQATAMTFQELENELGTPIFVKPANMGSSVGVHKIATAQQFDTAIQDAFQFDTKVLVEEAIVGREIECAVLGLEDIQVTSPGEIKSAEEYSFKEKYSASSETQLDIPAKGIDAELLARIRETARKAFVTLQCSIMSRVDMFLTAEGKIYVNEVNTIPGFTSISMYPKLWENQGLSYTNLITALLKLAIERHEKKSILRRTLL